MRGCVRWIKDQVTWGFANSVLTSSAFCYLMITSIEFYYGASEDARLPAILQPEKEGFAVSTGIANAGLLALAALLVLAANIFAQLANTVRRVRFFWQRDNLTVSSKVVSSIGSIALAVLSLIGNISAMWAFVDGAKRAGISDRYVYSIYTAYLLLSFSSKSTAYWLRYGVVLPSQTHCCRSRHAQEINNALQVIAVLKRQLPDSFTLTASGLGCGGRLYFERELQVMETATALQRWQQYRQQVTTGELWVSSRRARCYQITQYLMLMPAVATGFGFTWAYKDLMLFTKDYVLFSLSFIEMFRVVTIGAHNFFMFMLDFRDCRKETTLAFLLKLGIAIWGVTTVLTSVLSTEEAHDSLFFIITAVVSAFTLNATGLAGLVELVLRQGLLPVIELYRGTNVASVRIGQVIAARNVVNAAEQALVATDCPPQLAAALDCHAAVASDEENPDLEVKQHLITRDGAGEGNVGYGGTGDSSDSSGRSSAALLEENDAPELPNEPATKYLNQALVAFASPTANVEQPHGNAEQPQPGWCAWLSGKISNIHEQVTQRLSQVCCSR